MKLTLGAAAALALLFVIGACTGVPVPSDTDWCYFHDFTQYPYNVTGTGEYVEDVGWQTVEGIGDNVLNISLENALTVQARFVEVVAERAPGITGEITITAGIIDAWGIYEYVENVFIPAMITGGQTFVLEPETPDAARDTLSINLHVSQPIVLTGVVTRGYGANPFPSDNCIEPTLPPTVTIPPATNTPEPTSTPSPTAIPTWCYTFDFKSTNGGFSLVTTSPNSGMWVSGQGWRAISYAPANREAVIIRRITSAVTITHADITFTVNANANYQFGVGAGQFGQGNVSSGTHTVTWNGNLATTDVRLSVDVALGLYAGIETLVLRGTGTSPYGDNCSPTATPTPTPTPTGSATVTSTPTPIYTSTRTPSPTVTATRTRIPITIPAGTATRTATGTGTIPPSSTPPPTNTPLPPTDTRTAIPTSTRFPTSTGTPTPNPSLTPVPGEDEGKGVAYTNNLLEWLVSFFADLGAEIGAFFNWVINSFGLLLDWIGSFFGWLGGTFQNLLIMLGNLLGAIWAFIGFIFGIIGALIQIVGMIISIVINALFLLFSWILQIIQLGNEVITAWITASPTPIPGFPMCKSAPRSSDICAIWYVARHTLFSGTLGQLLITVTTAIIDLGILFWIIKAIRAFIRRGEGITKS